MSSWYGRIAAGMAILAVTVVVAPAAEKTNINQASPDAAKDAKVSAEAKAVEKLALAHSLIHYGRANKAPEALITAARILHETDTVNATAKPERPKDPQAPKVESKSKPAVDNSPKALLEEAKKMSGADASVVALADSVKIMARGVPSGPRIFKSDQSAPLNNDTFRIKFVGGEVAEVAVLSDGDSRIDLYVYDENSNLVASHVGLGGVCRCSWAPLKTGVFILKVVIRGPDHRYTIVTN